MVLPVSVHAINEIHFEENQASGVLIDPSPASGIKTLCGAWCHKISDYQPPSCGKIGAGQGTEQSLPPCSDHNGIEELGPVVCKVMNLQ